MRTRAKAPWRGTPSKPATRCGGPALKLARAGETSLAEVMRVCREDGERDGGV
jgi:hypothetical protein